MSTLQKIERIHRADLLIERECVECGKGLFTSVFGGFTCQKCIAPEWYDDYTDIAWYCATGANSTDGYIRNTPVPIDQICPSCGKIMGCDLKCQKCDKYPDGATCADCDICGGANIGAMSSELDSGEMISECYRCWLVEWLSHMTDSVP